MDLRRAPGYARLQRRSATRFFARKRFRHSLHRRRSDRYLVAASRNLLATAAQRRNPKNSAQIPQRNTRDLHPGESRRTGERLLWNLWEHPDQAEGNSRGRLRGAHLNHPWPRTRYRGAKREVARIRRRPWLSISPLAESVY